MGIRSFYTDAIITLDGEWHEMDSADEDEERRRGREVNERFIAPLDSDDWIVICDAHI